ncbi:alkaline phosphatase D family protein [Zavarzinella formosa]|uniref:alkaline phosphatase D family protein n=1 Tax=Zavarzinella formosa TaxID=360055 RepID=UPI0002D9338C|nr:alkaline phosphatase D family protein [Zavarzinella formosa]
MNRRVFIAAAAAGTLALTVRRSHPAGDLGPVMYAWCGAMTPVSCRVVVRTKFPSPTVRLIISQEEDFKDSTKSIAQASAEPTGCHLTFEVTKLSPKTVYFYGFEVTADGKTEWANVGRFQTFPEGAADFQVAFASCARTGSTSPVFDTIARNNPDLFIHMGDFHYENIALEAPALRRDAYALVHASETQSYLYRHFPIGYIWDDHDYLGNNTDGVAVTPAQKRAKTDARLTYQQCVPHYPLAFGDGDFPIGQAFTLGRARFILTDNRSEKIPGDTMLGVAQKKWFKDEIRAAKTKHPLIVWVNTVPWIGVPNSLVDFWAGYDAERRELADFFKAEGLAGRLCILSGDSHMLAIDDGSHSDYATGGGMPIPVFQAASLDQRPSAKGGPYSHPQIPGAGQFGLMQVRDNGKEIRVQWKGMTLDDKMAKGMGHEFIVKG